MGAVVVCWGTGSVMEHTMFCCLAAGLVVSFFIFDEEFRIRGEKYPAWVVCC